MNFYRRVTPLGERSSCASGCRARTSRTLGLRQVKTRRLKAVESLFNWVVLTANRLSAKAPRKLSGLDALCPPQPGGFHIWVLGRIQMSTGIVALTTNQMVH